jgi:hypothetical protein
LQRIRSAVSLSGRPYGGEDGLALWPSEQFPEGTRIERSQRELVTYIQEIAIAGDENVGFPSEGGGDNPSVSRVTNDVRRRLIGFRNPREWRKDGIDRIESIGRHLELRTKYAPKLDEDHDADHKIMFREHRPEDVRAEAARGEGRDEDVRIEADSHEMARNTSSSVR